MIYMHAFLGAIALLMGAIALISTKGGGTHKKYGRYFFYTMLASASLAVIIALLPSHANPFLLSLGIFSCYLLISGYRALNFKSNHACFIDIGLSISMLITGVLMIIAPIVHSGRINTILTLFGIIASVLSINDLKLYKNTLKLNNSWLGLHIGKMTGAYIASITAFIVVNELLPGIYGWIAPSILGGLYISLSIRKTKN